MIYRLFLTIFLSIVLLSSFSSGIVYEDGESGTDKWTLYDNTPAGASISALFDQEKQSNVIEFHTAGVDNGYMLGSFTLESSWNNTNDNLIDWDMKFSEDFIVYILVKTDLGYRYLYYTPIDVSYGKADDSIFVHFGLGSQAKNGTWQHFRRDIAQDVKAYEPNNNLVSVLAFLIRGSGRVDNIVMSGGADVTPPTITLKGDSFVTVRQNSNYVDAGATAYDDVDGNLTANIITTSNVDVTQLGTYTVKYNVSDSSNNQAVEVVRTVKVVSDPTSSNEVLILYDDATAYGSMGLKNAMFLQNLLGHFGSLNVTAKPVSSYVAGEMQNVRAVFYLGTVYDVLSQYGNNSAEEQAYFAFYNDILTAGRNVVWMNYNLNLLESYQTTHNPNGMSFAQQFGFKFKAVTQGDFNRVTYKNIELYKGVIPFATPGVDVSLCKDEGSNRYACELETNEVDVVDATKVVVDATTYSTLNQATPTTPYVVHGNHFWFVGDIPFSYMSEEDRYLAFSDLLHDMVEIPHTEVHKAIMRLEDVDARTELDDLNSIANYMQSKNIPFSVATIPQYEDPLGVENGGVATTELLSNSVIGQRLKELYDQGAIYIVQHGTTHQFHNSINDPEDEIKNPYNGLSGDDFEFMRVVETDPNQPYSYLYPTMNDSAQLAKDRILSGKAILSNLGLTAFCWEAPHYMAGPNHYRGIKDVYPVQYARVLYYPFENSNDANKKYKFIGQFFPYMIQKDIYGYKIIPENIHNIEDAPNPGYRPLFPADTIRFAKKLKVVRDGVASFFYHPYLQAGYLQQIVEGLEAEGYQFVGAPTLLQ